MTFVMVPLVPTGTSESKVIKYAFPSASKLGITTLPAASVVGVTVTSFSVPGMILPSISVSTCTTLIDLLSTVPTVNLSVKLTVPILFLPKLYFTVQLTISPLSLDTAPFFWMVGMSLENSTATLSE